MPARALVVTADKALFAKLKGVLGRLGCAAEAAPGKGRYELALADWDAVRSGPALRALRRAAAAVVVLGDAVFLGGAEVSAALAGGAADVLLETAAAEALAERLRPHLARFGPERLLRADASTRRVWTRRGASWREAQSVPPREFELLRLLLEHPGAVLTRTLLLERLWRGNAERVNPETVDRHVQRLRRRLGAAGRLIATVRGVGYRLDEPAAEPRSAPCRAPKRRKT